MSIRAVTSTMHRQEKTRQSKGRDMRRRQTAPLLAGLALACAALLLAACSEQITKHGQLFRENDIAQIQPGMGQEQVKLALGTPTTTTTTGDGSAYYYISYTNSQTAFLSPKEIDRKVLAVYFTPTGTVDHVANYGMQDGKVIDTVSRTTPAPGGKEDGILKSLFRNLGQKQIFGDG
jgi:outer membrane protein assembly factor BamE (lipoprotein component of BamABCDE complex)